MRRLGRWLAVGRWPMAALLLVLVPAVAEACPYCASRDDGGRIQQLLLGSMILFPFGVAYAVRRVLKSVDRSESAQDGDAP